MKKLHAAQSSLSFQSPIILTSIQVFEAVSSEIAHFYYTFLIYQLKTTGDSFLFKLVMGFLEKSWNSILDKSQHTLCKKFCQNQVRSVEKANFLVHSFFRSLLRVFKMLERQISPTIFCLRPVSVSSILEGSGIRPSCENNSHSLETCC